jgi:DNA-binding response OmpR family regulator
MDTALNILVVEDHDDLREATVEALARLGHHAIGVDCAETMDETLRKFPADLLLLDLNLPGEDGISIACRLRAAQPDIGIIMVTARNSAADVMRGYDSGADIYITKPVSPSELNAAIQALSRRLQATKNAPKPFTLAARTLELRGPQKSIALSGSDYQILTGLAKAPGRRLETWELLESIGKPLDEAEKRALTVHIVRLRKKLEQIGAPLPTIKSIRGTGYQLCIELCISTD